MITTFLIFDSLCSSQEFACSQSSRDQCYAWYGLFRLYVSAKYSSDTSMYNTVFDDRGFLNPEHFYDELEAYSMDSDMGGRSVTNMLVRFDSKEQISGSQICFMWKREYNVPAEVSEWFDERKTGWARGRGALFANTGLTSHTPRRRFTG